MSALENLPRTTLLPLYSLRALWRGVRGEMRLGRRARLAPCGRQAASAGAHPRRAWTRARHPWEAASGRGGLASLSRPSASSCTTREGIWPVGPRLPGPATSERSQVLGGVMTPCGRGGVMREALAPSCRAPAPDAEADFTDAASSDTAGWATGRGGPPSSHCRREKYRWSQEGASWKSPGALWEQQTAGSFNHCDTRSVSDAILIQCDICFSLRQ